MLNPFPILLSFALLAPFILRVVAGIVFINLGFLKITRERKRWTLLLEFLGFKPSQKVIVVLGGIEMVGGFFILAGAFTQITALIFSVILLIEVFVEYKEESILSRNIVFYLLMFAITLSLIFSGAGFFAFDLPL